MTSTSRRRRSPTSAFTEMTRNKDLFSLVDRQGIATSLISSTAMTCASTSARSSTLPK
ncbi:unnamed protein product [Amoebophrya sp. A25]|nr:unnamed protein product [Amoebophrya sp. A25]|eukprot:GSA25T00027406001.1